MDNRMYSLLEAIKYNYDYKTLQTMCEEIILSERVKGTPGKYNIFDYCSKDKNRPQMTGVFHDKGTLVASDGCIIVVESGHEYDETLEGQVVTKKGEIVDAPYKYPKYMSVKPQYDDIEKCIKLDGVAPQQEDLDLDALKVAIDKAEMEAKGIKDHSISGSIIPIKVGQAYVGYKMAKKLLKLMKAKGVSRVTTVNERRPILVEGQGWWCVCMPCMPPQSQN